MKAPLYKDHATFERRPVGSHAGLWYTRCFDRFDDNWTVPKEAKEDWITRTGTSCGDRDALKRACCRQLELAQALHGKSRMFSTSWHFVTGLGLPHPVENGFTWHPTLGVPFLCGAAVKGLVRAWVEESDELGEEEKEARILEWFGDQERVGSLVFFDAIPYESPKLAPDIMTPHQNQWYLQGGSIADPDREPERVPADYHDPTPVPFLVVTEGKFLFSIAPRTRELEAHLEPALEALAKALDELGAGAKTAVGYGQMVNEPEAWKGLLQSKKVWDEKMAAEARRRAEEAKLRAMSPRDRELLKLIGEQPPEKAYLVLLEGLEKGQWDEAKAPHVARRTQELMRKAKRWRLSYTGSNKKMKKALAHSNRLRVFLDEAEGEADG